MSNIVILNGTKKPTFNRSYSRSKRKRYGLDRKSHTLGKWRPFKDISKAVSQASNYVGQKVASIDPTNANTGIGNVVKKAGDGIEKAGVVFDRAVLSNVEKLLTSATSGVSKLAEDPKCLVTAVAGVASGGASLALGAGGCGQGSQTNEKFNLGDFGNQPKTASIGTYAIIGVAVAGLGFLLMDDKNKKPIKKKR